MITGRFVLPADVALVPVASLPEPARRFRFDDGDVAITRARSRTPARIVGADAAELLAEFRAPASIVEAVIRFSLARGQDAEELLESSYPLVASLISNGVLIEEEAPREKRGALARGEAWRDWTVTSVVQVLEDSELYQLRRGDELAALKLARAGRELLILERAGAWLAPRVLEAGDDFLLLEWIRGVDAKTAAGDGDAMHLCVAIAEAFARLHERGVIHGDVHPRNVLVQRDGSVRLIDLGASRIDDDAPPRAGVAFFYEPELAAAMLERRPLPRANEAGEQYAVAALLHLLLTGHYTHDFSLEREELLRQVAFEEPRAIDDPVLARALSKEPGARFASMREFARTLERRGLPRRGSSSAGQAPPLQRFVDEFLSREFATLDLSLNTGLAGIAYVLYRIACVRDDGELLARADLLSTRALESPFTPQLDESLTGRTTPWHTRSGLTYVHALIADARGDARTRNEAIREFARAISVDDGEHVDLATGTAGALLAAAHLRELCDDAELRAAGDALHARTFAATSANCGMAHGRAGLLYAAMRWSPFAPDLRDFEELAIPAGRGARWPWSGEQSMPGWCNGSAGLVLFFARAGRADLAEDAAWHAWEAGGTEATLCCGLAGRAYAMLEMHRLTGAPEWLDRAHILAGRAAANISGDGLFKGAAGVAVLLSDLERPEEARFPLFE